LMPAWIVSWSAGTLMMAARRAAGAMAKRRRKRVRNEAGERRWVA
jgi:hypothetical protein